MVDFDNLKNNLLVNVDTVLKYAKTKDSTAQWEVFLLYKSCSSITLEDGTVKASDGIVIGHAIRVAYGKKIGFFTSSGDTLPRMKASIDEAYAIAKSSQEDKYFESFCSVQPVKREGILKDTLLEIDSAELINDAVKIDQEARARNEKIKNVTVACSVTWGGYAVGNTQGVQAATRSLANFCQVRCTAIDGDDRKIGGASDYSREHKYHSFNLGKKAATEALSLLKGKKLNKVAKMSTIWDYRAAAAYIMSSVAQGVNGFYLSEKMSPLTGKINENIASPLLTIVDNGVNPRNLSTQAIDAEGNPQQKTPLITKGILKNFLYDDYYARKAGVVSTGNSLRGFLSTDDLNYEYIPSIAPTTLEISPGKNSEEQLLSGIDGPAIYIIGSPIGILHSNPVTGEFSVVSNSAFLIDKGEKQYPLQSISIAGSFYQGLHDIIGIANNVKRADIGVNVPTMAFDGFTIVSQ